MRVLEITDKYRCESEIEAKELMEEFRAKAAQEGYCVIKSGYTYKSKKAKGEIVDEAWIVTITKNYGSIWE